MSSLIKVGARVRQKPRVIEGLVIKREIIGEGVTYFVYDEATEHEIPLHEDQLEVLVAEPAEDSPAETQTLSPSDVGDASKLLG